MFSRLLLLFIVVPFIELLILVRLSGLIGFGYTVLVIIITGMVGASLVRKQGLQNLRLIEADLKEGRMPADRILSGILILIGGAFLITPGIITDLAGLALMIPGNRRFIVNYLKSRIQQQYKNGGGGQVFFFHTGSYVGGRGFGINHPETKNGQSPEETDRGISGGADET